MSKLALRLAKAVEPDLNSGCWLWAGNLNRGGYATLWVEGRRQSVHRVTYALAVGEISPGLELDHLCRTRCCVNPAHLEPVTKLENVRRGFSPSAVNARKSHCAAGHAYDQQNTYYYSATARHCRACNRARVAEYKARQSGVGQ